MTYPRDAVADAAILARIAAILEHRWDPGGAVRDGLSGGSTFYQEQALIVAGMLGAEARDTEVQRYLRQLEQRALPTTAHSMEARHELAVTLWRVARGLPNERAI
jgi:hypothetical protein